MGWVSTEGGYDKIAKDAAAAVAYLRKERGVSGKVGAVGFCWGGSITIQLGATGDFAAVACVHPAFFGQDDAFAKALKVPVCILPAKGDPMEKIKAVTDAKPFGPKCLYQRFDDQEHGARVVWGGALAGAAWERGVGAQPARPPVRPPLTPPLPPPPPFFSLTHPSDRLRRRARALGQAGDRGGRHQGDRPAVRLFQGQRPVSAGAGGGGTADCWRRAAVDGYACARARR